MSEFSEFQGTSSTLSAPSVHQIVFRWEGNQGGRQGTGMKAVAHSCPADRAEQLGRELGPLLWVSGPGAARPSVVRTLSRDGEVLLVQRWPTMDRTGRPSTISHVLMGPPGTLKTRQCLALAYGGWGKRESAERATGSQPMIDCAELDVHVRQRLPKMEARLDSVRGALMLATAEWLRDPAQRVSLLVEEEKLSGWPERDETPLVYLGLFLLFHDWPGHEWTFATYDTVDTHPLRLTSVPRWEQDTGGSGPLARVMGGKTANPRFEHQAASRLVEHLLAHRSAPPGVPQLTRELSGGATMDWERRQDLLKKILKPDRRPKYPEHAEHSQYGEKHHQQHHQPQPQPQPQPPYRAPKYEEPQAPYAPPHQAHQTHQLHEDLRGHERGNHMQRSYLMAQLRELPDEVLLHELRSGELPSDSVELLLSELGTHQRREARPLEMQHALCERVLSENLYLAPHGQPGEPMSGAAQAGRAADLFTWAVAPLARDPRYLHHLYELLHRMSRAPHPIGSNWLEQSIISPANGEVPDLPPTVWRQLLHEALARKERPQPAVPPPPPPPLTALEPQTPMSRLSELSNNVGCVLGVFFTMIVVLIAIALIVM
ncbi:hypothetical protein [Streptomyces sp. NBC_00576]|uniref:hypothetical protein n=1 Tax=Streptomyces sp. NBC_00576 TaxID=2903665 RepID=UPI002E8024A6|nr:hypothetical protein [Streptomyces sp. NBC_00576]WUB72576.1 hypothetical protein OG734_22040 [Streptomyces sp. NBC_00576]